MKVNTLASAVDCLRDIAALSRRQASELAKNWLVTHGYARHADAYIPGRGFGLPQTQLPQGILWTTREYPCGCSASGQGDVPAYCGSHGHNGLATIDTALKDSSSPQSIPTTDPTV
jgi:hypothetical protein